MIELKCRQCIITLFGIRSHFESVSTQKNLKKEVDLAQKIMFCFGSYSINKYFTEKKAGRHEVGACVAIVRTICVQFTILMVTAAVLVVVVVVFALVVR